jgi:ATP-dependent RNA helicase DHX37/DHR1
MLGSFPNFLRQQKSRYEVRDHTHTHKLRTMQLKILRQLLAAGFVDQVAARKDLVDKATASGNKYTTAKGVAYRAIGVQEDVFIHPSSVLANSTPPDYIVFHEIVRTSRVWLKGERSA